MGDSKTLGILGFATLISVVGQKIQEYSNQMVDSGDSPW